MRRALFGVATVSALAAVASCSLGLDESLIGRTPDASLPDTPIEDASTPDVTEDGPPPPTPEGGVCTKDEDCKTAHGCLTAKCDLGRKACVFPVCRSAACSSAACDAATQKCGAPSTYKYRAAQFSVGAAIGRCIAAVHPFLFVGTVDGVVAFDVGDPQNAAPRKVPVIALTFLPTQMIASGSRVFFVGPPTGAAPSARVPLAWIDVPATPFVDKITAQSVLATYNRPPNEGVLLHPRENDTALLLNQAAAASYPAAAVEPPLVEPLTLTATPIPLTAGMVPQTTSGTRLVMNVITIGAPSFAFVNGAGSAAPQNAGDVALGPAAPVGPSQAFATSPDGAVFWSSTSLTGTPGQPMVFARAVKSYFLVVGAAANFDATKGVDVEVYAPGVQVGQNAQLAGPVALLDAKTALVTTAIPANLAQTNVQFVKLDPLGVVKNADMQPRRLPITLPIGQLAAAGSHGIGYVLAVDPNAPAAPVVHVFDPECAP